MKNKNFPGSVFITAVVFLMVFFNLRDETLFAFLFALMQLFAGIAAVLLILLRLVRILKNKNAFMYTLAGTCQIALLITDIGLLFDHSMVKSTMLIFAGLNALLGCCILTDIGTRRLKREAR